MTRPQPGNPYIVGSPLRGEQGFFGRQDILDWVKSELRNSTTKALVLFGQRRIGKTSLLLQLGHILPADELLPIYFNLQDQASRPLGDVLADLADTIAEHVNLESPNHNNFDDEGHFFRRTFLPQLYRALEKSYRPVILLDEFDVLDRTAEAELPKTAADKAFLPFLSSVMAESSSPAFVFVVGRRKEDFSLDFTATFKASLVREIWVLDRESAEQLVRQAEDNNTLRFTDQAVSHILRLTSCHPYLTQLLCQRIWERAYTGNPTSPPQINVPDVKNAVPDALEAGDQALAWLWEGLEPAEMVYAAALAELANEHATISENQVIEALNAHAGRLRTREVELAPCDLVKRRVLEIGDDEKTYRFAIELFRRWVCQNKPLPKVKDALDQINEIADDIFRTGQRFFDQHKWKKAEDQFRKALQENPQHFKARVNLGETLLKLERADDAVAELEQAYELDKDARLPLSRALVVLAKELKAKENYEEALDNCKRALEISPKEREAQEIQSNIWTRKGDTALEQGDLETALTAYQKAGNKEKQAQVHEQAERWADAASVYEQLEKQARDKDSKAKYEADRKKCQEEEKLASLFAEGIGALEQQDWERAQRAFADVIKYRVNYAKDGKFASQLLDQAVQKKIPPTWPLAQQPWAIVGLAVISALVIGLIIGMWRERPASSVWETATAVALEASKTVPASSSSISTSTPLPNFTPPPELPVRNGTPMPPIAEIISPENAGQVVQLARWGKGIANDVMYSPNGTLLAVASPVGIWLYSTKTLNVMRYIETDAWITSVDFSPNGNVLAAGAKDNTVQLWNVTDGTLLRTLRGHESAVTCVTFSPDGNTLASGAKDNTVRLWDVSDGTLLNTIKGHTNYVNNIAFSPDGTTLASGAWDNTVRLWDISDGTIIYTISSAFSVAFSPDGETLATGSEDHTVRLWNTSDGTLLNTLEGHMELVISMNFSPDGSTLATGSRDGTARLWDTSNGTLLHTLEGYTNDVHSVAFSPDGNTLATGAKDDTTKLWSVSNGTLLHILEGHMGWVTSMAFSPNGNVLATGSRDNIVRLWDTSDGTLLRAMKGHTDWITSMTFSFDGSTLATGAKDNSVRLWDTSNGTLLYTLTGHASTVTCLTFSPYGNTLSSASDDKTVRVWNTSNGVSLNTVEYHAGYSISMAFSPDGDILASGSDDETIHLWSTSDGALVRTLRGHESTVTSVIFSLDGDILASGSDDKTIRLWSTSDGTLLQTLRGHESTVTCAAFSPDGNILVSGSDDKTVRLWNTDGHILRTLENSRATVTCIAISPNRQLIASGSHDGIVRLWGIPLD